MAKQLSQCASDARVLATLIKELLEKGAVKNEAAARRRVLKEWPYLLRNCGKESDVSLLCHHH